MFPLVLLQAKVVGLADQPITWNPISFPLVLLQAKVVGIVQGGEGDDHLVVSISSPSSEGGGIGLRVREP